MKKIITVTFILIFLLTACAQALGVEETNPQNQPAVATQAEVAAPADAAAAPENNAATDVQPTEIAGPPTELVVMTHDSFAVSEGVIKEFETAHNAKVTFLKSGDAGAAINKAILTKDAPIADVFFGVDNTYLSRALDAGIFETYASPMVEFVPDDFRLDLKNRALPVDYGDVCINYSKSFFAKNDLTVPTSLDDLTKPEYFGLLVVENPATSSPGMAFLLATIEKYGEPGYLEYWKALKENGVTVVDGWETAYYTNFSGSSGFGPQPMVVSYSSSPAAEVVFATTELTESPNGTISSPGSCFRQVEFAGILTGTKNRALAEKFLDFLLDVQFQEGMPLTMFVYPVNSKAKLPEVFSYYGQAAAEPAYSPQGLEQNRDRWIQEWTATVLQ